MATSEVAGIDWWTHGNTTFYDWEFISFENGHGDGTPTYGWQGCGTEYGIGTGYGVDGNEYQRDASDHAIGCTAPVRCGKRRRRA